MLLVSGGEKAKMLINIFQCTEQLPATKTYPAHSANTSEAAKAPGDSHAVMT